MSLNFRKILLLFFLRYFFMNELKLTCLTGRMQTNQEVVSGKIKLDHQATVYHFYNEIDKLLTSLSVADEVHVVWSF